MEKTDVLFYSGVQISRNNELIARRTLYRLI